MLEIISVDESDKWDSVVKSFSDYDVYYLSGYTKAFRLHGDGEPTLIYYHDEEIRAINVVMKRDIENDKNFKGQIVSQTIFDITTPYGYGGFIIEGTPNNSDYKKINEEYSNYCRSKNIITEFVRFHPVLENSKMNNEIYEVIDLGKTITIDLITKEQIWNDLSSKNRNVIRKAIKSGVEIYWGRSPELIDEFIPLYNATMKKDDATDYYYFKKSFIKVCLRTLDTTV